MIVRFARSPQVDRRRGPVDRDRCASIVLGFPAASVTVRVTGYCAVRERPGELSARLAALEHGTL